jgi:hypothetical protein
MGQLESARAPMSAVRRDLGEPEQVSSTGQIEQWAYTSLYRRTSTGTFLFVSEVSCQFARYRHILSFDGDRLTKVDSTSDVWEARGDDCRGQ